MKSISDAVDELTEEEKALHRKIIEECMAREKEILLQKTRFHTLNSVVSETLTRHLNALEELDSMTRSLEKAVLEIQGEETPDIADDIRELLH